MKFTDATAEDYREWLELIEPKGYAITFLLPLTGHRRGVFGYTPEGTYNLKRAELNSDNTLIISLVNFNYLPEKFTFSEDLGLSFQAPDSGKNYIVLEIPPRYQYLIDYYREGRYSAMGQNVPYRNMVAEQSHNARLELLALNPTKAQLEHLSKILGRDVRELEILPLPTDLVDINYGQSTGDSDED